MGVEMTNPLDLVSVERERQEQAVFDRQVEHEAYRRRVLPSQYQRALRRVEQLKREADRLGITHLLRTKQNG